MKDLELKTMSFSRRTAKACSAVALGLLVYETAPVVFDILDNLQYSLYSHRIAGEYLSYGKGVVEGVSFPMVEAVLTMRAGKNLYGAFSGGK